MTHPPKSSQAGQAERTEPIDGHAGPSSAKTSNTQSASAHVPIDFATFIISLATQVSINLGLTDLPDLGVRAEVDLDLARQTLDILALLADKTRGNLTEEEHKLLQKLLYDLRVCFVEVSDRQG